MWRCWHSTTLVTLANDSVRCLVPNHAADEHILMYRHVMQLCQNWGKNNLNTLISIWNLKLKLKTLQIIEKEPSIIEEYDPYRSWHGSQYGSRYSLHGGRDGMNKGYTSGGSTIHSNRSLPIDSDHYAIVHSRPGSRHSNMHNGHNGQHVHTNGRNGRVNMWNFY